MSQTINNGNVLFTGSYINSQDPWWVAVGAAGAGAPNLAVSTLTVNGSALGNITLGNPAPIVFQRPAGDINGASESLVMNLSQSVPTYPTNGQFITATKTSGTAYDDIAVKGLQVFGAQTTVGNAGAYGYITGDATGVVLQARQFTTSSIFTSSLFVGTVVSTTTGTATSYTATQFMSTPVIIAPRGVISTISTVAGLTIAGGDVSNTTGRFVVGSTFVSSANIITPAISTFNISTATIGTSTINAGRGLFSTLNTTNFNTSSISTFNVNVNNNLTVNNPGVLRTTNFRVDGNAFYYGGITGLEPTGVLTWNGDVLARAGIVTPEILLYPGGVVQGALISTNGVTPYGMEVYSDAFTIKSVVGSPYIPLTTTTNNIVTQNLLEQNNIKSPAISTNTLSTNIVNVNQVNMTSGNVSTLNAVVANISTANISSLIVANFAATQVDATTLSSLTSRVQLSLICTIQLNANVSVSPNVNLGLGNTIAGLVGGAATQGLGVAIGTTALATGAMALVTARQSGGVNNSIFQTVNGSTQLQFSTIGTPATSVFLTTDSALPLTTPGNPTQTSQVVPAGTYCVRSVSDPLNVDSDTQAIQMFGQWVPVIQPTATISQVAISTLTARTIFAPTAVISSLTVSSINATQTVAPSTLFASTINQTGNLIGTNSNANITWAGRSFLPCTITYQTLITNAAGAVRGSITGTDNFNQGINILAQTGIVIQNSNNAIVSFNQDQTMEVYSTLTTIDVQCTNEMWVSTLYVSTLNTALIPNFPSTLLLSTMNMNGNLIGTNSNAFLDWEGTANFYGASAQFNGFLNSANTNVSIIRVGTDNNLVWNYGAMTLLSAGVPGISSVTFKTDATVNFLSTLTAPTITCTSTMTTSTMIVSGNLNILDWGMTLGNGDASDQGIKISTGGSFNAIWAPGNWSIGNTSNVGGGAHVSFNNNLTTTFFSTVNIFNNLRATDISTGVIRAGLFESPSLTTSTLTVSSITLNVATASTLNTISIGASTGRVRNTIGANSITFENASPFNTPVIAQDFLTGSGLNITGGNTLTLQSDEIMRFNCPGAVSFMTMSYLSGLGFGSALGTSVQGRFTVNGTGLPQLFTVNSQSRFNGAASFGANGNDTRFEGTGAVLFNATVPPVFNNGLSTIAANVSSMQVSSINGTAFTAIAVPAGGIMPWAGGASFSVTPPSGWLLCDGRQYAQTSFPGLFAVIGTTYNRTTPTVGNFFVPDLRFTFPMGAPSYTTGPTAMVNAPVITFYSLPTNLGIPGVAANQIWRVVTSRNGVLVPGMTFGANTGPNFQPAFIDRMLDGTGDIGTYIMGSIGVGTWPVFGSVGSPVTQTVVSIGSGADFPYKIGTVNASGYNANPNTSVQIYNWGRNITGSNVGIPGATANTFGGVTNTYASPAAAGALAFQTAPNFMNLFYIIKT